MDPTVDEVLAEELRESFSGRSEATRSGGEDDVIEAHKTILTPARSRSHTGVRIGPDQRFVGDAGCSASSERDRRWFSQALARTSYPACPIRAISSVALDR